MKEIVLSADFSPSKWRDVLDFLWPKAHSMMVVIQESNPQEGTIQDFVSRMGQDLLGDEQCQSWPGTVLLDGTARCLRYLCTPRSRDIILSATDSLFSWLQPQLPEDLSLFRRDGSVLLESIAHERLASVYLLDDEVPLFELLLGQ